MEDHDWEGVLHVLGSQWQYEVLYVFNHTANDDMVLSKHRILHSIKDDILSVDRLIGRLGNV